MFTILGPSGFIGGHLVTALRQQGHHVYAPPRDEPEIFSRDLGHVVYAVGVTADFANRPFDTVEAHVCFLRRVLQGCTFQSLLYLSSTRIYARALNGGEEQRFSVDPADPDDLYNLSKLMGESLCWATGRDTVRIARLSNVYGGTFRSHTFLNDVLRQALGEGRVRLRTAATSTRDYVSITDVTSVLPRIAQSGKSRVYNVASGRNVTHGELIAGLSGLLPLTADFDEQAPPVVFPPISIDRAREEFGFAPKGLMANLPDLVANLRKVESGT